MSAISVTLVADPVLRRSLRRLYPELPEWAQRWAIATPGRPLPLPPAVNHPAWGEAAAKEALQQTRDTVNATHPIAPWIIKRSGPADEEFAWVGPTKPDQQENVMHPAAAGGLLSYNVKTSRHGRHVDYVSVHTPHGQLALQRHPAGDLKWYLTRKTTDISGVLRDRVQDASFFLGDECVFGDGTDNDLRLADHHVTPEQETPFTTDTTVKNPMHAQRLVDRWHRLTSADDRARISQFWLGHPHPVLAAAGLATVTQLQSLGQASAGARHA
jgi:hypothetical protein